MVPIASQQAIQETGVEIKCPLMHKYIVSGTYDHNGGVLTSRDGIKITIPKDAIIKGDLVTFYTVVDLCGPFVLLHQPTHTVHTCTNTHNTHLHLRTRGCYSTDGIRANGLYHVVELLRLNVCHLSCLCDLKFILFSNIFSLRLSGMCQPLQF